MINKKVKIIVFGLLVLFNLSVYASQEQKNDPRDEKIAHILNHSDLKKKFANHMKVSLIQAEELLAFSYNPDHYLFSKKVEIPGVLKNVYKTKKEFYEAMAKTKMFMGYEGYYTTFAQALLQADKLSKTIDDPEAKSFFSKIALNISNELRYKTISDNFNKKVRKKIELSEKLSNNG